MRPCERHFLRTPEEKRRLKAAMTKFLVPCSTPPGDCVFKVKAYEPCALFDALDEPEKLGPWIPEYSPLQECGAGSEREQPARVQ